MEVKDRDSYIDILNVLASIGVVFIHVSSGFWDFSRTKGWLGCCFYECFFYFAVPIFFMITGATLIDYRKRYNTKIFFQKRIKKTVFPYFCWTTIGILFLIVAGEITFTKYFLLDILNIYFSGELSLFAGGVYWFLLASFTIYLCIPVISLIQEDSRKRIFVYIICLFIILDSFLPFISKISGNKFIGKSYFSMPFGSKYLVYILLGYVLSHYEIPKNVKFVIYSLGVLCGLSLVLGTQYLSFRDNSINGFFKGYTNLPCIFYSAAIFLFFKNIKNRKVINFLSKITKPFRNQTFGIYMIHIFIRNVYYVMLHFDRHNFFIVTIMSFVVFFTSWLVTKLMQHIPFIKKLVP